MANPEHQKWLEEGVKPWNKLQEREPFTPDLRGIILVGADLKVANLVGADLSCANLIGVNLSGAILFGAILRNTNLSAANISGADLRNANLSAADLSGAILSGANLSGANLSRTCLRGADLSGANLDSSDHDETKLVSANLKDAILNNASLIGTNLADAKVWKAILYPENKFPKQYLREKPSVHSIGEFLEIIRKIKHWQNLDANTNEEVLIYFRGEPKYGWPLTPSVMREHFDKHESEMLLELVSRRPEEFNGIPSAFSQLVLARHHYLNTRILDVTKNPLVALFNACEGDEDDEKTYKHDSGRLHIFAVPRSMVKPFNSDTVSIIANFAKLTKREQDLLLGKIGENQGDGKLITYAETMNRLYQFVRQEKPYFKDRLDPRDLYRVFVVEPQHSPERLRAQSGAFLVSAFHKRFERDEIRKVNDRIPVYAHYKLSIPWKKKPDILKDLRLMDITHERLFPGLDSSAAAITARHNGQSRNSS